MRSKRLSGCQMGVCDNPENTVLRMQTLRMLVGWMVVPLLAGIPAWPQNPPPIIPLPSSSTPLVLEGGTVVDVTDWGRSARDQRDAVVIVDRKRVSEVGSPARVIIPRDARV